LVNGSRVAKEVVIRADERAVLRLKEDITRLLGKRVLESVKKEGKLKFEIRDDSGWVASPLSFVSRATSN